MVTSAFIYWLKLAYILEIKLSHMYEANFSTVLYYTGKPGYESFSFEILKMWLKFYQQMLKET